MRITEEIMQYIKLFVPFFAAAAVACTAELVPESPQQQPAAAWAAKICNTSADAKEGTLIVRFSDDAVNAIEAGVADLPLESPVTRSGISSLDGILAEMNVSSMERVFPYAGKHEARTRAAGLHKWYVLRFSPDVDLEDAAAKIASAGEVSLVQFNTRVYRTFSSESVPFAEGPHGATKSMVTADFNDPQLFWQWHYINNADQAIATESVAGADINVAEAWKLTGGDPRVIVAIVDGGVKYNHPDLAANMFVNEKELNGTPGVDDDGNGYVDDIYGYNFVADSGTIDYDSKNDGGHGTHVAGTVAAVNNNGVGVCGIAGGTGNNDGVRLLSCQIFSDDGTADDIMTGRAIKYAADMGASVLQCSYGYDAGVVRNDKNFAASTPLTKEGLDYFFSSDKTCDAIDGGIAVYAAGNEAYPMSAYPGAYAECISVTSFAPDFLPAYYTNFGPGCNIAAPGGELAGFSGGERAGVLSTLCSETNNGEDYGYMQGTSMACPHVSGVIALGLSYALKKGLHFTRDEFMSMVLTSVNEFDSRFVGDKNTSGTIHLENYVGKMGTGAIDAYQLLMQIEGTPCLKVPTGKFQLIPLTAYFGQDAADLTYIDVQVSDEDMAKLGMDTAPEMYNGMLKIKCTSPGVAHLKVRAIAGGDNLSSDVQMGGTEISKEFAVISRDTGAANGGWL